MSDSITFTRAEVKAHEAAMERLRYQVRDLTWEVKRLKAIKLPPPDVDCVVAFGHWYGMPVEQDMDIQTQVAWENWQIAWNAGEKHTHVLPGDMFSEVVAPTDEQIDAIALKHPFVNVNREGRFTAVDKAALRALVREAIAGVAPTPGCTWPKCECSRGAVGFGVTCKAAAGVKVLDKCEVCGGERGGVPGNENRVDGKLMCDYCHGDLIRTHGVKGPDHG